MANNKEVKVWHLILFNFFFNFLGEFVARYSIEAEVTKNIVRIGFTLLFILFIIFILSDVKHFIVGKQKLKWLTSISIGLLTGLLLWYTMVLIMPATQLLLDSCRLDLCNDLLKNYYTSNNNGRFSDLNLDLIVSMVLLFTIIGPLKEEILYRVAIMSALTKRFDLISSSIIIAVIFAVFHLKYFVFFLGYSLLMSALVLKYRNILPAVIAHGTYNGMIYFLVPSIDVIDSYKNLGMIELLLVILLLGNIYYWSCHVIKKNPVDWLSNQ